MTTEPDRPRLLVTVCTYNEVENLPELIRRVFEAISDAELLVVDDDSPDGTGRLADELAAADRRVHVLHRSGPRGLGVATVDAFRHAIAAGYDVVVNLDADLSHPPERIPALLEALDGADVAVGSRYVPGGAIRGWGPVRHVMSRCINTYSRAMLGLRPRDVSGSYRGYRTEVLARVDFDDVVARGYAFMEEILFRCRLAGATMTEVPITFVDRTAGSSKINLAECVRAVVDIAVLAATRRFATAPRSVKKPAAD